MSRLKLQNFSESKYVKIIYNTDIYWCKLLYRSETFWDHIWIYLANTLLWLRFLLGRPSPQGLKAAACPPCPPSPVVSSKFSTVPISWNFRHSCRNAPHWNPKKHLACYHPNGPTPLWFSSMRTFSRTCLQGSWTKALQGMVTRKAAQKHSKSCWLLTAPALVDIPHPSHTPPAFGVDLTASCVTAALSEQTDIANPRCFRKFEIEDSGW